MRLKAQSTAKDRVSENVFLSVVTANFINDSNTSPAPVNNQLKLEKSLYKLYIYSMK